MALQTYAGGTLFGERYGTGIPRVLALHGWGRDRGDFASSLDGLEAISLDLPGFGVSPAPESVWGAVEYAAALEPVLEEFSEPPVIVAHSFGGRAATVMAASSPEAVKALVLLGVPLLARYDRPPVRPAMIYRVARWLHKRGLISDGKMEQQRRRHGSADYRAASGVMREVLMRAVGESYEGYLGRIRCPVHLLWGEDDDEVPLSVAERAVRMLDHGSLEVLAGIGHHVPLNAPEQVRAAIERLL